MFINFDLLSKHNFSWADNQLLVLQIIKQKQYDLLESCSRDLLNNLYKQCFIYLIEGKKDQAKHLKIRLTDKGKNLLRDIQIAEITDESVQLSGKLISLYEQNGLNIENKKKVVQMISWFLAECPDFAPEKIYETVSDYINSNEKLYTRSLNSLIWKGESVFSSKWSLSQSKLYSLMTKQ